MNVMLYKYLKVYFNVQLLPIESQEVISVLSQILFLCCYHKYLNTVLHVSFTGIIFIKK